MKGFDNNEVSVNTLENLKGTLENRVREIYNQGYSQGYADGIDAIAKTLVGFQVTKYEKEYLDTLFTNGVQRTLNYVSEKSQVPISALVEEAIMSYFKKEWDIVHGFSCRG